MLKHVSFQVFFENHFHKRESLVHAEKSSRLPGFYELSLSERVDIAAKFSSLTAEEKKSFAGFSSLSSELTDTFIENAIGTFSLPLGVATNFRINGRDLLIPMAV